MSVVHYNFFQTLLKRSPNTPQKEHPPNLSNPTVESKKQTLPQHKQPRRSIQLPNPTTIEWEGEGGGGGVGEASPDKGGKKNSPEKIVEPNNAKNVGGKGLHPPKWVGPFIEEVRPR